MTRRAGFFDAIAVDKLLYGTCIVAHRHAEHDFVLDGPLHLAIALQSAIRLQPQFFTVLANARTFERYLLSAEDHVAVLAAPAIRLAGCIASVTFAGQLFDFFFDQAPRHKQADLARHALDAVGNGLQNFKHRQWQLHSHLPVVAFIGPAFR